MRVPSLRKLGLFPALVCLVGLCGCVNYLETPTPPGEVPPPSATVPPPSAVVPPPPQTVPAPPAVGQGSAASGQGTSQPQPAPYQVQENLRGEVKFEKQRDPLPEEVAPEVANRFRRAYQKAHKPRMAFYFNRQLSARVTEWVEPIRGVRRTGYETTYGQRGTLKSDSYDSRSNELNVPDRARPHPGGEAWTWEFEDSVINKFLATGAKVIDRSMMMRVTAAQKGVGDTPDARPDVHKLETDALLGKADILVELLVTPRPTVKWGYEFRAVAKEVRSGEILASCSSTSWYRGRQADKRFRVSDQGYTGSGGTYQSKHPLVRESRDYVATKDGYVIEKTTEFPTLNQVTTKLVSDLMDRLALTMKTVKKSSRPSSGGSGRMTKEDEDKPGIPARIPRRPNRKDPFADPI